MAPSRPVQVSTNVSLSAIESARGPNGQYRVVSKYNLRELPNGKVVGSLEKDMVVAVLESSEKWSKVLTANGQIEWVVSRALKKLEQ